MKTSTCLSLLFGILTVCLSASAQTVTEIQRVDDGRRWLESKSGPPSDASAIVRAAAANARNHTDTENRLLAIIRSQPSSDAARDAHELLSRFYTRTGQYRRLLENLDLWARTFPNDSHVAKESAAIAQFRGLPNQINGPLHKSRLRHGPGKDFAIPISINGMPANYLADTGAWLSVMTEAEAKRLNLTISATTAVLSESSGKGVKIRTAIAKNLVVGSNVFHDVSFAILPEVEPWSSMPAGRGGIIGVPILLHLGCIRWMKGGTWDIGCSAQTGSRIPNMTFYKNRLLLTSHGNDQRVFLTLDTGAETTDLNSNFAEQFAGQIKQFGVKDTTSVSGVGGTAVLESVSLPVDLQIGNTLTKLRPAHVTMQVNPAMGGDCCVGNIGLDLLTQTGGLTIDFTRMTLHLRPQAVRRGTGK